MSNLPLIQLALDFFSLPPALDAAYKAHKEVDVIEIGTPLSKACGMLAVSTVRELCPDNLILADIKSPDVGGGEAKMAFDAGADWMTVLGAAPIETVKLALAEANSRPGKEMFIELTGIRDIMARAKEWRSIGVERMVYHRGWDEGNASRLWEKKDIETIKELIRIGFKISVAGGLEIDTLPLFSGVDISVFIIGRAIYGDPEPAAAARRFRAAIADIWSGSNYHHPSSRGTSASTDTAAKAIRWGVSELGLKLTVDGRNCPGCNSPDRFCKTSRIDVLFPSGVDSWFFTNKIIDNIGAGESGSVGINDGSSFYIDVSALSQINENKILNMLSAVSAALQNVGQSVNQNAAMIVAHDIMTA